MAFGTKIMAVFKASVWVILLGSLVACQSGFSSYAGKTVDAENRIELLEGGPHMGSWETRDFLVEFQYSRKRQDLEISGRLLPQQYLAAISCPFQ